MCGICGVLYFDKRPVSEDELKKLADSIAHRGPDGEKIWWDPQNKITLGHNLLSIMSDPKLSIQPWKTPDGNVLVYNGEIFNYYELKQKDKENVQGVTRVRPNDLHYLLARLIIVLEE